MKSPFISDLQDGFENHFSPAGSEVFTNFFPSGAIGFPFLSPFAPATPTLPAESFEAQAAVTQSGSGGAGSTVVITSSTGFTIDLIFDAAAMAAPASFRAGVEQAASILSAAINDKITVNINIDYSGTGGGAAGGPDNGQFVSYSTVRSDLINDATPGDASFNSLPNMTAVQGQTQVAVWNSQLKLFGTINPNDTTTDDGSVTFATDINSSLLVGVALHELTHALGRVPYGPQPDIFDLFRFASVGTMLFSSSIPASAAYFSEDGGKTKLADFGKNSDPSDFLNSGVQGPNDPFNEFYSGSTLQTLTIVDKQLLDALGFSTVGGSTSGSPSAATSSIVANPSTVIADGTSTTTVTVTVEDATGHALANTAVTLSASGSSNTFGAISGTTNSSGVFTTTLTSTVVQNETITASEGSVQETTSVSFLPVPVVISTDTNSFGSIKLIRVGSDYFLENASTGVGPELQYNGSPVTTGEFTYNGSTWTPIGAAAISGGGYEVAWKLGNTGTYSVWATDSTGNYASNLFLPGSGTSTAFETLETSFNQDLNGDGVIGVPPPTSTVISTDTNSFGSIKLVQVGNNYFLENASTGVGPELQYNGSPVTAGEFVVNGSTWTPIGAAATSTGYEVAWKLGTTGTYSVWATDSTGNYTLNLFLPGSGTSTAFETLETSFNQDLNGDGVIGVPPPTSTVISTDTNSFGSIKLVQVGNNYFLENASTGVGPELQYNGSPVTAGEFMVNGSTWTPIGAAATSTGYEVAWKLGTTGTYSVWATDSTGNYTSNLFLPGSGKSTAFETLETSFNQDLNGDGVIGIPVATLPVSTVPTSSVPLVSNDSFLFRSDLGNEIGSNIASTGLVQSTEHFPLAGIKPQVFFHEVQATLATLLQIANGEHDSAMNPGGHNSVTGLNIHFDDLHASGFFFH
jgi:serralysin